MKITTLAGVNLVIFASLLLSSDDIFAQTTLSGDHVIEGNLDVGTNATKGVLKITGQTGSSAQPGIHVTGEGGVLFEGALGFGRIPKEGEGVRFMWYPKKAAFKGGHFD